MNEKILPSTEFAEEIQLRTQMLLDQTKKKNMHNYLKYEDYYDRKTNAAPLKEKDCFILQLKADVPGTKILSRVYRGMDLYVVAKVLLSEIYIVRQSYTKKL